MIILSCLFSNLMNHHVYMVQRCMHTAEKQRRKPSPRIPTCFEGPPQYAPHPAIYDEIESLLPLLECLSQFSAKPIKEAVPTVLYN